MKTASFGDIVVAFSDFLICLENADEVTFREAKKFCSDILRRAAFPSKNDFRGEEE